MLDLRFNLVLTAVLATLSTIVLAFAVSHGFSSSYIVDDGYFYLKVAQNLDNGHGFTFDGIEKTNGFHPLYLLSTRGGR